jgi:hypothetical protein
LRVKVYALNEPDVAIEDILVIVVNCLHDFVANPEGPSEPHDGGLVLITVESCMKV